MQIAVYDFEFLGSKRILRRVLRDERCSPICRKETCFDWRNETENFQREKKAAFARHSFVHVVSEGIVGLCCAMLEIVKTLKGPDALQAKFLWKSHGPKLSRYILHQ